MEGYQAKPGERRFLSENWVAPKYFETLGMPLLMGRDFSFQDQGRPRVAIVNQTLVRYFFGNGNPIGRHITFDGDDQPFEIVGVVGDTKSTDTREPASRFVYFNMLPVGAQFLAVRAADRGGPGGRGGRSAPRGARIAEDRARGGCHDDWPSKWTRRSFRSGSWPCCPGCSARWGRCWRPSGCTDC